LQLRREALANLPVRAPGTRACGCASRQACEVPRPTRLHRGWVLQELFVEILDEIGISTVQSRGGELIGK
jgi:hypothetical protein